MRGVVPPRGTLGQGCLTGSLDGTRERESEEGGEGERKSEGGGSGGGGEGHS